MMHRGNRGKSAARRRSSLILLLCLVCAGVAGLWSQSAPNASNFIFPQFVAAQHVDSGIALFNPTADDASVSLALTGSDGRPEGSPVTVVVPALGQIARTSGQLFGTAELNASLEVTSSTAGIVAYYQTFDPNGVSMDGADAAQSALNLIFPVAPANAPDSTTLVLLNKNIRDTLVQLRLWKTDGSLLGQATAQVRSQEKFQDSLSRIFPAVADFSGASHVTATSRSSSMFFEPQTVFGTSLFSNGASDSAALNALTQGQTFNSGAIPLFQVDAQHFSILSIANVEGIPNTVSITAIGDNGASAGTIQVSLPANGGFRQPLQNRFSLPAGGKGWLLLQGTGRIAANILNGSDEGAISAIPVQRAPQSAFVFPQAVQGSGFFTEISLANPGPATSFADLVVIDPDGTSLASAQITLPPGTAVSRRLDDFMPELKPLAGGVLAVRASAALFGTEAIWADSRITVTNLMPQPVPASYAPAPLQVFAVTGTVTLNGLPVKDFNVILSGPGGSVTRTLEDGRYIFAGLPAGRYSLRVDQFGFEFQPAQVDFELATASKRQDFQGFIAANGILVRPASIPVGSPDTTVTIYGTNFDPTSAAFVGPVRLETTFVSPTQLEAVLPAYFFETAQRFELNVITQNTRVSNPYGMVVFLVTPQLASVTSARDIVQGSPAAAIVLSGSGFLADARVKINGNSDGIVINLVADNEILAVVPAGYFAQGGIFPVTVENPYPVSSESNVQLLTVFFPRPAIESISPAIVSERLEDSSGPMRLDVFGYGFRRGAVVLVDEVRVPTSYCEESAACVSEHLIATVDPKFLRASGFRRIAVQNPDPALDVSQIAILRVESLQPTITSVSPGSATVLPLAPTIIIDPVTGEIIEIKAYSLPLLVFGTNFDPKAEARVVRVNPPPTEIPDFAGVDEVISSNQLVFTFQVDYPAGIGDWMVQVKNPQPGGGMSEAGFFSITQGSFVPNPFLTSISPDTVAAGGPSFTLTVNGTNFTPDSQINFYSAPLVTTFVSPNQLTAVVPALIIKTPGKNPVTVTNSGNGGTSNKIFIEIR